MNYDIEKKDYEFNINSFHKLDEEEFFEVYQELYQMHEKAKEEVEQYIVNEYGLFNSYFSLNEEKKYSFNNKNMTIKEIKKYWIEARINKFWNEYECFEFKLAFLAFLPTSSLRCRGLYNCFLIDNEHKQMNDAINSFYTAMRLINEKKDNGYEIYKQLIEPRINYENQVNQNNTMTINLAISLEENQEILKRQYKRMQIVKLYDTDSIEKLEHRLFKYIIAFLMREMGYYFNHIFDVFNEIVKKDESLKVIKEENEELTLVKNNESEKKQIERIIEKIQKEFK